MAFRPIGRGLGAAVARLRLLAAAALMICATNISGAKAQSFFERLVSPGALIEGHAKLEKDCSNCHATFDKGAQTRLCLDCHKAVRADIDIKVDEYKRQVVSEIESCARQFRENRCQPGTRIPAMQDMCERWEK